MRRKCYFYGSTLLDVSAFEYTGNSVAILKGRLLVLAVFVICSLSQEIVPLLSLALALGVLAIMPWIIQRALQFNARNSLHRNVRFGFHGGKMQIFGVLLNAVLLVPVTLGIGYPWYLAMKRRLFVENSSFGSARFAFAATTGEYYAAAMKISFAFFGFLAGSIVTLGIGLLPFYLPLRAYAEVVLARPPGRTTLAAGSSRFALLRLDRGRPVRPVFRQCAGVLLSLGLLVPWAAIRSARRKLEASRCTRRRARQLPRRRRAGVGAVGDEAGELPGFDFGL